MATTQEALDQISLLADRFDEFYTSMDQRNANIRQALHEIQGRLDDLERKTDQLGFDFTKGA